MAIADTITSMQTHTTNAYNTLAYATDLTGVNKNLANLKQCIFDSLINSMSNTLNPTWNNLPKITTTPSTNQSINNTIEAPMRVQLNASALEQFTTTGKNVLKFIPSSTPSINTGGTWTGNKYVYNGITYTINSDNSVTISGTSTGISYLNFYYSTTQTMLSDTELYTFSKGVTNTKLFLAINENINSSWVAKVYASGQTVQYTPSGTQDGQLFRVLVESGNTVSETTIYPMVVKGTTVGDYEPYTAGASPNPNYPQDVHTISGDNTIRVCGKNLFDINNGEQGAIDSSGNYTSNPTNWRAIDFISVSPNTTYTFSINRTDISASNYLRIYEYDSSKTFISPRKESGNRQNFTFTTGANTRYIKYTIYIESSTMTQSLIESITPQLELGNQATTYQAYNGKDYEVNLPMGNNKFTTATPTYNDTGVTIDIIDKNDVKVIYSGTGSFKRARFKIEGLKENTDYTFKAIISNTNSNVTSNWLNIKDGTDTNTVYNYAYTSGNTATFNTGNNTSLIIALYVTGSTSVTDNISTWNFIQLEEGTTVHSFEPYGITPIEYCKIPTYEDKFIRNSGKNLFDRNNVLRNKTFTSADVVSDSTGLFVSDYIKVQPSTTYYVNEYASVVIGLDSSKTSLGYIRNTASAGSFTTGATCEYVRIRSHSTTIPMETAISNAMMNKGSSSIDYEPYGNNTWYIKKTVGKIKASELIAPNNLAIATQGVYLQSINANAFSTKQPVYCNVLINKQTTDSSWNAKDGKYIGQLYDNYANIYINKDFESSGQGLIDALNWLKSINFILYYILATPTYTQITGTLAEQLEAIYNAISKDGMTNISQVNNDLPFIFDTGVLQVESTVTLDDLLDLS